MCSSQWRRGRYAGLSSTRSLWVGFLVSSEPPWPRCSVGRAVMFLCSGTGHLVDCHRFRRDGTKALTLVSSTWQFRNCSSCLILAPDHSLPPDFLMLTDLSFRLYNSFCHIVSHYLAPSLNCFIYVSVNIYIHKISSQMWRSGIQPCLSDSHRVWDSPHQAPAGSVDQTQRS